VGKVRLGYILYLLVFYETLFFRNLFCLVTRATTRDSAAQAILSPMDGKRLVHDQEIV
jgi:hypothetical protein